MLRNECVGERADDLFGFGDGATHPLRSRGQLKLGAEQQQHFAPFERHALRHRQDQPVAFRGADKGERDPGIAGGRLDQHGPGLDATGGFRRRDHRPPDAVLDRVERIEELALRQDVGLGPGTLCEPVDPDQRCRADRIDDAVIDAAAKFGALRSDAGGGVHQASSLVIRC